MPAAISASEQNRASKSQLETANCSLPACQPRPWPRGCLYLMWAEPYTRKVRHKGVIARAGATSLGSNSHCLASAVQPRTNRRSHANSQHTGGTGRVLHSPELGVPDGRFLVAPREDSAPLHKAPRPRMRVPLKLPLSRRQTSSKCHQERERIPTTAHALHLMRAHWATAHS